MKNFIKPAVFALAALAAGAAHAEYPGDGKISFVIPYKPGGGFDTIVRTFAPALEEVLGKTAQKNMLDIQPGDMPATWADATLLQDLIGPMNKTELKDGVANFVKWYNAEYG